jgi:hypothetical protein
LDNKDFTGGGGSDFDYGDCGEWHYYLLRVRGVLRMRFKLRVSLIVVVAAGAAGAALVLASQWLGAALRTWGWLL